MPVWPQNFYTFGVSLKTAATEWKLRQKRGAAAQQERALSGLLPRLAQARFWREAGLEPRLPYSKFQSRIPPTTPKVLAPAVARMKQGEPDVLWPGACSLFLTTPGTTNGGGNALPVTEALLAHFRRAAFDSVLYYTVRARHAAVFRGRHLWLTGSTAVTPLGGSPDAPRYQMQGAGLATLGLPPWVQRYLYEPGSAAGESEEWTTRLDTVISRAGKLDISLLAAVPRWAIEFGQAVRARRAKAGQPIRHLQDLWPNLECFVHTGVPIGPYYDELRDVLGPGVRFHEMYVASEALVAAQDGEPAAGLRLIADAGVFYEFLPLAEFDETRIPQLGSRLVPLSGVRAGGDYVVFVTTPAGLVRCLLGDVVRFISTTPPRLIYAGRAALRLHAFGENVLEKEITDALAAVCQRHHWTVVNFHVAPLFSTTLTGTAHGRHEWWVELNAGTVETPRGPQLAEELDAELQRMNPGYALRRRTGVIASPYVRLVMPGVFRHWMRFRGKVGAQHKMLRCRGDRDIADELAQITQFARD